MHSHFRRLAASLSILALALAGLSAQAHVLPVVPAVALAPSAPAPASLGAPEFSENPVFFPELPFGDEWCAGAVCGAPQEGQPRRFTAKERDTETGLDYFGARYYSARTGRFTGVDPVYTWRENLVDPQLWNRYAYARNNPLRYVDPDGRAVETPWDVFNVSLGFASLGANVTAGNYGAAALDVAGLAVDLTLTAVPGVPGGAATAINAGRLADKAGDAARAADRAGDLARANKADGARFIVEPNGTVVDTLATPSGRYRQPDRSLTDVLQKNDHGHGLSHTHKVVVHRKPGDPTRGSTRKSGRTHPVTFEEAKNIESGVAEKLPPRRRQ